MKRRADAPPGFFTAEAAGLAWLARAVPAGGVPTADVLEVAADRIVLRRLAAGPATPSAAEQFGRRLAATHRAGADRFGAPPAGWQADGWIGPLPLPHVPDPPLDLRTDSGTGHTVGTGWGPFFATLRLRPFLRTARDRGAIDAEGARVIERVCSRLEAADPELTGPAEPVARLHGDLWSGNVIWTPSGAVLIDPAAHGGHRESDLAMLALFGLPLFDRVLAAYHESEPLAPGRQRRVGLHQLFPLLVHAALFGAGYGVDAVATARRYA